MEFDGYSFFTHTHKLYVQGVRRAVCQRLQSVFGDDWWERGVELALRPEQRESLRREMERRSHRDRESFLDPSHFGWVIVNRHNEVFADAFNDTIWLDRAIRRLTNLRNEWAHVQEISLGEAKWAANTMTSILASLRCEEALEIERMNNDLGEQPNDIQLDDSAIETIVEDERFGSREPTPDSWGFWRQIQSFLVLETSVEDSVEDRRGTLQTQVTVKAHNTAPDSNDWPSIHFQSVEVTTTGGNSQNLGNLGPGQTAEGRFLFPRKGFVDAEFSVSYRVNGDKFWQFKKPAGLPTKVITPLLQEFVVSVESLGIRDFVNQALAEIGVPHGEMTLGEIALLRKNVGASSGKKQPDPERPGQSV